MSKHFSTWQWLRSFVSDVRLESTGSSYNRTLDVLLSKGSLQLCTDKAIYSWGTKYMNFKKAFEQIQLPEVGAEVLVLGLGLGSVPFMLETYFGKEYNYTAVEIDEEIIMLASHYVLQDMKSAVSSICADATTFMMVNKQKFDIIAMDIFVDDHVPEEFESTEFLKQCKKALTKNGVIIYNRLYQSETDQYLTDQFFDGPFQSVFPRAKNLVVKTNMMLISQ